jgi:predicted secreted Zn-dependent protease
MEANKQAERAQRRADRSTLTGVSATLSAIIRRHKEGETVYGPMAARIMERERAHRGSRCESDCPYCQPEYVGVTLDDFEGYDD